MSSPRGSHGLGARSDRTAWCGRQGFWIEGAKRGPASIGRARWRQPEPLDAVRGEIREQNRRRPPSKRQHSQVPDYGGSPHLGGFEWTHRRVTLVKSTGDATLDNALKSKALTGLQLTEAPPKDMPMPITLSLSARRPN